jgi:hypothetical protein
MRSDERRHEPAGGGSWHERFTFDISRDDGFGASVLLELDPTGARYRADVIEPERGPVVVRDFDVAPPRGGSLAVRADGLWSDLICETPFEHWSIGLEAFGVRLDDPADAYRGEIGDRIAVGLDLEWEAYTPPFVHDGDVRRYEQYEQAGSVHGEVLLGDESVPFEGRGERVHRWGPRPSLRHGRQRSAFQLGDGVAVALECDDRGDDVHGFLWRAGDELRAIEHVLTETHVGRDDIPVAARYVIDHTFEVDVEVLGAAPVLLDERVTGDAPVRWPRALCRYESSEGWGTGWSEWCQRWPLAR